MIYIINNIDPKEPLYIRHPVPKFKNQYATDKYWDEQFRRWHEGYSGLTGLHYFYLQEFLIPDGFGRPIIPYWRDCDSELFESWQSTYDGKADLMVIKRREIGLSTFGGGVLPIYTALTKPGSDSVMTSASRTRLQALFRKKTEFMYDKLDPYYREEKARKSQSGQLFIAKEDRSNKTFSGLQSSIWSIDTVKDPYGFESFRAAYIFLDEIFLHPKVATVKASASSSRMSGFDRLCPILLGGTCGLMDTKGAIEAQKIYKSSKESKTNVLFLGGTKGIEQFMVNGHTDEKAAEQWILQRREELSKAEDKTEYFKFLTSYPLSIEEVFNLVADCALPQECQVTLNECERKIDREQIVLGKYSMRADASKIIAEPDTLKGKVNIIIPPQRGHTYIAGTDPIPFGNNALGEGSEYSIVIMDDTTKECVADYSERNLDSRSVIRTSVLLQKLYKSDRFPYGAPTMLELNRGEVVLKEYQGMNEESLLAPMPLHLGIVWENRDPSKPFGVYANNQIVARCEALALKYLITHGFNLRHKRLIQEYRRLGTEANTDLLDAWKMVLLFGEELMEMRKKQTPVYTNHKIRELVRDQYGRMVYRYKDSSLLNR